MSTEVKEEEATGTKLLYNREYLPDSPTPLTPSLRSTSSVTEDYFDPEIEAKWGSGKVTIEAAMEYAEIGYFQMLVLIPCLFAFATTSMIPNILNKFSFIILCDYEFLEDDTNAINNIIYICSLIGGIICAIFADIYSRKWVLMIVLFINAISSFGLVVSHNFFTFALFRAIGSFTIPAITAITIVFLAEFQNRYNRGTIICCLQLAWIFGILLVPQLPLSWHTKIVFAIFPPLIAACGLLPFPESPRFLLSHFKEGDALESIKFMHYINTGVKMRKFPITDIVDNKTPEEIRKTSIVKQYIPRDMQPELFTYFVLIITQFALMFGYNTMSLYFNDLVVRNEALFAVDTKHLNLPTDCHIGVSTADMPLEPKEPSDIELVNAQLRGRNKVKKKLSRKMQEKAHKSYCTKENVKGEEYYNPRRSLVAFCSVPAIILLLNGIDVICRKFFITISHVCLGGLICIAYYMHTKTQGLIFSCVFDSFTLISIATSQCIAVDMFPTRIRVLGVSLLMASGQLGAIVGQKALVIYIFPTCIIIVSVVSYVISIPGLFALTLPATTGTALR